MALFTCCFGPYGSQMNSPSNFQEEPRKNGPLSSLKSKLISYPLPLVSAEARSFFNNCFFSSTPHLFLPDSGFEGPSVVYALATHIDTKPSWERYQCEKKPGCTAIHFPSKYFNFLSTIIHSFRYLLNHFEYKIFIFASTSNQQKPAFFS